VRGYRLIGAVTFSFRTDGINCVFVVKAKVFDDGIRIVWNVEKGFLFSRGQRVRVSGCWALNKHKRKEKKVGGNGQDKFGTSAA